MSSNPIGHVNYMQERLQENVNHLRDDIKKISDPRCKAMFETSAEVILGIIKAFEDYKQQNEAAWK